MKLIIFIVLLVFGQVQVFGENESTSQYSKELTDHFEELIVYYEDLLSVFDGKAKNSDVEEVRKELARARNLLDEKNYSLLIENLEEIRINVNHLEEQSLVILPEKELDNGKAIERSTINLYLAVGLPTLFIISIFAFLVLGKKFMVKTPKNKERLAKVKNEIAKKDFENNVESRIIKIEKKLSKNNTKKSKQLLLEIDLIKKKNKNGLNRLAEQYLEDLEKKMEEIKEGKL